MTQAEIDAQESMQGYDSSFTVPDHLVSLAGENEEQGYGHYTWNELFHDPKDDTYIAVSGSGCSCGGSDDVGVFTTARAALASFPDWARHEIEAELTKKGLL